MGRQSCVACPQPTRRGDHLWCAEHAPRFVPVRALVSPDTYAALREVAELTGRSMGDVAGWAVDHAMGPGGLRSYLLGPAEEGEGG